MINPNHFQQKPLFQPKVKEKRFSNFYGRDNQSVVEKLRQFLQSDSQLLAMVYGESGTGKSHILQAACQHMQERKQATIYINFSQLNEALLQSIRDYVDAEFSEATESKDNALLLAVDDVRFIANKTAHSADAEANRHPQELALLSIYERFKALKDDGHCQVKIILSAKSPPEHLSLHYKDLQTRLATSGIFSLRVADDTDKQKAIREMAEEMGLGLEDEHVSCIFKYCPRDFASLKSLIRNLEIVTLNEQRKITNQLIRQLIRETQQSDSEKPR